MCIFFVILNYCDRLFMRITKEKKYMKKVVKRFLCCLILPIALMMVGCTGSTSNQNSNTQIESPSNIENQDKPEIGIPNEPEVETPEESVTPEEPEIDTPETPDTETPAEPDVETPDESTRETPDE